ncbi:hypothetical protein BC827DRAFT_871171 [Russula dissimulans]|nr:hypothetical protein BC827DRAFT_871171 [Russula dissimulans]
MSSTTRYSAQLKSILDAAFDSYTEKTGVELVKHPSGDKLQNCRSSEDVLQVLLEGRTTFKSFRDKLPKFLDGIRPVVNAVHTFSAVLGEAATLVPFPGTTAIFVGIDVLLSAVIDVSSSYDALLELFECIARFLKRLHVYTTKIPLSSLMSEIIVKIMVEVLSVLALATKQVKQGRFKKFTKKLLGESEVEDMLQRLDRLTQEEAQMTEVHTLAVVHEIFDNMKVVMDDRKASAEGIRNVLASIQQTTDGIKRLERDQLQKDIRNWLSPPDPSINHNIARKDHHDGTASWFIEKSSKFKEWKSNGSLLWINGTRMRFPYWLSNWCPDRGLAPIS